MAKKSEPGEGLKSLYLELENFKNIGKTVIDIGGRSMLFVGRNEAGKSTLIQAMISPLDAHFRPSEPIKKGEERAKITHKIGGLLKGKYKEYTLDMYFTQKDKKGRLVVTNEDGEVMKSPASLMKSIIGNVSFDVTGWMTMKKNEKLDVIKKLTGCHVQIDEINNQITEAKNKIKFSNDRVEQLEGALSTHGFTQEEISLYSTEIPVIPIQQELSAIAQSQGEWDNVNNQVNGFKKDITVSQNNITKANNEMARAKAEYERIVAEQQALIEEENALIAKNSNNIELGTQWLQSVVRPTIDEVNKRLNDALVHNEKCSRISQLGNQSREVIKLKDELGKASVAVKDLEAKRMEIIKNSQLSIPGLSFDDMDIYIDGLPVEDTQINTARIFDISVDIAMALNPNLKIIFLHDGSLFDKEHLKLIVDKIENNGYMAVVEMVDFDGGDLEVKFTESELK